MSNFESLDDSLTTHYHCIYFTVKKKLNHKLFKKVNRFMPPNHSLRVKFKIRFSLLLNLILFNNRE